MKIGDKVRFLNDTGGGVITEFMDRNLVKVLTEDGFEFPVLKKEVIVVSAEPGDFEKNAITEEGTAEVVNEEILMPKKKELTLSDYLDEKKPKPERKKQEPKKDKNITGVEEVDLHIENILPDYNDLSSGEILEAQMDRFTTVLNGAIMHKQKKVVFIHGKGAGKLKYELKKKLETDYPRLKFQDASFKEYGYGATLVIIQ